MRFRGYYTEDKRIGVWEFYDENGEPEQKVDFTNNQIRLYRSKLTGHIFRVMSGNDSIFSMLDRPPLYLGGSTIIKEFIANEILPPLHKTNERVEGTVFIEFTVDSTGMTSNHHVLRGIGTRCNLEALRVVKTLPDKWIPGVLNGRAVSVNYIIPVVFDKNTYSKTFSYIISAE